MAKKKSAEPGEPEPASRKKVPHVNLSPGFHRELKALVALLGETMGGYIERQLADTVRTQRLAADQRIYGADKKE